MQIDVLWNKIKKKKKLLTSQHTSTLIAEMLISGLNGKVLVWDFSVTQWYN